MQSVDYTTLVAICAELRAGWVPARVEQVHQRDRHTLAIALRTLAGRDWLTLCWHPQAARLGIGAPPPRTPDTFTFSDQLRHQLKGLALSAVELPQPWDRVVDLQFAQRPDEPPLWHLYVEIMGKYSNVILTDATRQIVTTAHQVHEHQSSVRTIQTGQPYQPPPPPQGYRPRQDEKMNTWRDRVGLLPAPLDRQLYSTYQGVSPALAQQLARSAELDPQIPTDQITETRWQHLWHQWQQWLTCLNTGDWQPVLQEQGYYLLPSDAECTHATVQALVDEYYRDRWQRQQFDQLHYQLSQKIRQLLKKLRQKAEQFRDRLQAAEAADSYRIHADLLMAYSHEWQPGMTQINLPDFETGQAITITLNPEKTAIQNAQHLYKRHQKLKRSRQAIEPLLLEVTTEIDYLEQVEAILTQLLPYQTQEDWTTLTEIRTELSQQGYVEAPRTKTDTKDPDSQPHRYQTPSGFELWVGRNNRQNDQLTFRTANEYDLWFHTQEIPGSHVLLRLKPGAKPDNADLQFAADVAAYYSRGRQSDQVPVVYTQPKFVYKPKGAKPGVAIYKREQVIWGRSHHAATQLVTPQTKERLSHQLDK